MNIPSRSAFIAATMLLMALAIAPQHAWAQTPAHAPARGEGEYSVSSNGCPHPGLPPHTRTRPGVSFDPGVSIEGGRSSLQQNLRTVGYPRNCRKDQNF
jgi:hypothetical protein